MLGVPLGAFLRSPPQNSLGTTLRARYELLLGALVKELVEELEELPLTAAWKLPL